MEKLIQLAKGYNHLSESGAESRLYAKHNGKYSLADIGKAVKLARVNKDLSETRAKDREAMAKQVEELAERYGWRCVRNEILSNSTAIVLDLTGGRGLSVSVEFDGKSTMPDNFCLAWHFDYKGDKSALLSDRFGRFMGASVNSVHRRKCTCFAQGLPMLLDKLEAAMEMVADGKAFIKTTEE